MGPRGELALLFGLLHVAAMLFVGLLLVMFLRSRPRDDYEPPDGEEGEDDGPGNDRTGPSTPRDRPSGGLPLPDAQPARVRLRGHEKLGDLLPAHERRPAREPAPAPEPRRVSGARDAPPGPAARRRSGPAAGSP